MALGVGMLRYLFRNCYTLTFASLTLRGQLGTMFLPAFFLQNQHEKIAIFSFPVLRVITVNADG